MPVSEKTQDFKVEVYQHDWMPGFAAFHAGSAKSEGKAHIVLNLGGLIAAVLAGDVVKDDLPYVIADCIMHEVIHALEEWAGAEFSEERVESLIESYRAKYQCREEQNDA